VLSGGRCPLADEADAIVVLLDPDDERTAQLVRAHREQSPGTPVLVHHHTPVPDDGDLHGCIEVEPDGAAAVAQVLSLIGTRPESDPAGSQR
jgi:hypothetical protein